MSGFVAPSALPVEKVHLPNFATPSRRCCARLKSESNREIGSRSVIDQSGQKNSEFRESAGKTRDGNSYHRPLRQYRRNGLRPAELVSPAALRHFQSPSLDRHSETSHVRGKCARARMFSTASKCESRC